MSQEKRFPSILDMVVLLVASAGFLYIYIGFFFPDRSVYKLFPDAMKITLSAKLFLPFLALGAGYLYYALRTGKIGGWRFCKILAGVVLFLLGIFLLADLRYGRTLERNTGKFHMLFLLQPPALQQYDPAKFNVVCLGGSTTEFKDRAGRDWPSRVEQRLSSVPGWQDVRFHNMGKQWYNSEQILIHYLQNVKAARPQAIIFMEDINDFMMNADFSRLSLGGFRNDYGHFAGPATRLIMYGCYSRFFFGMLEYLWYQKPAKEVVIDKVAGLEAYERNVRALITLARADGTKVILMTQPNIYKEQMSEAELAKLDMMNIEAIGRGKKLAYRSALEGLRAYNDRLRVIAREENVPLIDLEPVVPKSLEYFYDDVHYQDKAYDFIADFISRKVRENISRQ